jgi:hypothetical protein
VIDNLQLVQSYDSHITILGWVKRMLSLEAEKFVLIMVYPPLSAMSIKRWSTRSSTEPDPKHIPPQPNLHPKRRSVQWFSARSEITKSSTTRAYHLRNLSPVSARLLRLWIVERRKELNRSICL